MHWRVWNAPALPVMPCTTSLVFLSTKTDIDGNPKCEILSSKQIRNSNARNCGGLRAFKFWYFDHSDLFRISIFVLRIFKLCVCESRACFHRGRGTAPSSKLASPFSQCQSRLHALSVSRKHYRNLPPRTRRWCHRVKVAKPDDNPLRLWSGQDRTRPMRHPFGCA